MKLFENIYSENIKNNLKKYYENLGFKTTFKGNILDNNGMDMIVSDKGTYDFFNENSSGIHITICCQDENIINFWSIRLANKYQGKGIAKKLVDGFIDIVKPQEITCVDLAQKGFVQWLENSYPDIYWVVS